MSKNEISDELSQVHPFIWIFLLTLAGAGVTAWWNSNLGPIVKNTIDAVKSGNWTQSVGELPQVGEVTAVTVLGVVVAAFVALFFVGRGIRALTGTKRRRRDRDRDEWED